MPPFLNAVAVSSSARRVTLSNLAVIWVPWTVTFALIFFSKTSGNAVRARTEVSASRTRTIQARKGRDDVLLEISHASA